jgi:isopentenyl-diphosphate delta-isomerase
VTATDELVVLLDEQGAPIGTHPKISVHHADTPLHLAFSLYLFDASGRLLMTRRALDKRTWPGVWTNTCCGHPGPDESPEGAIHRRLRAELGMSVADLHCVLPDFAYRARDASGVWENERCPVWFGRTAVGEPDPDPDEVMEWAWADWPALGDAVASAPFAFSPWLVRQLVELRQVGGASLPR